VAEALHRVRGTWRGRGTRGVERGPWAPGEKRQGFFRKNTTAQLISGRREYLFLVPVPRFLAALSSVHFVPFSSVNFSTVRSARSTVPKNANHRKTCIETKDTSFFVVGRSHDDDASYEADLFS
jgi:hypothetical protein